ncbi:hypothetical protein [Burkholderia contaminans]|uniref:hypothetical protein n=1 Tax=Burkholderia contaminans TaxID=488447 RepID=UPI00158DCDF5|nr:hypothetical protein [Burkholderia contaminans]
MAKQKQTQTSRTTLLPGRRTIILNNNVHGNLGKTTETKRLIEAMTAITGIRPIIISADPSEPKVLFENYGERDENGNLLTVQSLEDGVVEIDFAEKDGKLANLLAEESIQNRDVVIDTKGGDFNAFASVYASLQDFYDAFPDDRFIVLDPIPAQKSFGNLETQYQVYSQMRTYTEIHIVRIFSLGMAGSKGNKQELISSYNQWKQNHPYPSNIQIHEVEFNTEWKGEDMHQFIRFQNGKSSIREAIKSARGNPKILSINFLKEGDREWAKILLPQELREELAFLPNPTNNRVGEQWGEILFEGEIEDIAASKSDPQEKQKWLDLLRF